MANRRTSLKRLFGYGFAAVVLLQLGSCVPSAFRTLVAAVAPAPDLGSPPYRKARAMTATDYAAVARFPDLDSCLFSWGDTVRWDSYPEDVVLPALTWNRIQTPAEAEVCLFHLFSRLNDVERSRRWLEGQGFRVEAARYNSRIGGMTLNAGWFDAARGPLFKRSLFRAPWYGFPFPYSTSVHVQWLPDNAGVAQVMVRYNSL